MDERKLISQVEYKLNRKVINDKIPDDDPLYKLMDAFGHKLFEVEIGRSGKKGVFYLFFILDHNINAYSLVIEDAYIICITTGTMEMVPYWFVQVTDSDKFMRLVGGREKAPQVAGELTYYFLAFLLLHEFGHLICGHVKYLSEFCVCPFMAMLGMREKINNEDLQRESMTKDIQSFEYEADVFAGNYMCGYFLTNDLPGVTYFVTKDKITRAKLIMGSMIFLSDIVALYDHSSEKVESLYLPASYRFLNHTAVILSNCKRNPEWGLSERQVKSILEEIYPQTVVEFYRIFKFKSLGFGKMQTEWEDLSIHVRNLEQHWDCIRDKVMQYSLWRWDEEKKDG